MLSGELEHDPLSLFDSWLGQATESEPNDPNAVALATCTPDGIPSVRMVLAKRVEEHRFAFFTNVESRKGMELETNLKAALCFYWKSLRRQVRIEGPVHRVQPAQVDRYFHSRSRDSQIGAAISDQSRPLSNREELERRFAAMSEGLTGEVPRPEYWKGYYVEPVSIEFWMAGEHRLHDRALFTRTNGQWQSTLLFP